MEKCFLWTYTEKVSAYVHKLLGIWQAECDCGHIEKNWCDMSILMSVAAKWYKQSSEKANKVITGQNLHIVFSNFRSNITSEKK